jgi:DNA helicase II / ATP-dependent DNA helicase PcrA
VARQFIPSALQQAFFDEAENGTQSVNLIAVAGSGKSTTCIRTLPKFGRDKNVVMLSFGNRIVRDLKVKFNELQDELGQKFPNVRIQTFHSSGNSALMFYYRGRRITPKEVDKFKLQTLVQQKMKEEDQFLYGKFVCDLVSYAKGAGIGIPSICGNDEQYYYDIIEHHDMMLEREEAKLDRAVHLARALLVASYKAGRDEGWYDFDDMIYLPLAMDLRFFQQDVIICDEAQDTNPVRMEMLKRMLKRGGRLFAVGDPKQAIFGFTGATNQAMDVIKDTFKSKEMFLNVSYRCPKAVVSKVKGIVPYFEVHEQNIDGDEFNLQNLKELIEHVDAKDAIVCRNVAPMVSLAFKLIGSGRACHVLGSEIGKGLIALVKKQKATDLDDLKAKITTWRDREVEALLLKNKEEKAAGVADRAECIFVMMEALPEHMRHVDGLLAQINNLFQDEDNTLCLSSIHKAKGREWHNVVIYCPERMPSPWARKAWMREQEDNLEYVARTRTMNHLMFLPEVL